MLAISFDLCPYIFIKVRNGKIFNMEEKESGIKRAKPYRIAAVFGSPRREGNTDILLNSFLDGASDSEYFKTGHPGDMYKDNICQQGGGHAECTNLVIDKIIISHIRFSPCRGCGHCSLDGECIVNDEMQQVYPKLMEADLIAVASPVFFTAVSGYLKAFIDRFQRFWALKYELKKKIITTENKKGLYFSCAGSGRPDIFDCSKKTIRAFFDVLHTSYCRDFCYNGIDFKGDINKDKGILEYVYSYGVKADFLNN